MAKKVMTMSEYNALSQKNKILNISIDFIKDTYISVPSKQLDSARYIAVTLTEDGITKKFDLNCSVNIRMLKPDNTFIQNECGFIDDGRVIIELTEQMLIVDGRAIADLEIILSNGKTYSTKNFCINISPLPKPDLSSAIGNGEEYSVLLEIIRREEERVRIVENLDKLITEHETSREKQEQTRQTNETDRKTAESSRKTSETTRDSAEKLRKQNEDSRISSENTRDSNESTRKTSEAARVSAENTRKSQETKRESSEDGRKSAESIRESQEENRISAENTRKTNESTRESNEATRKNAESTRNTNETNRRTSENTRISDENLRKSQEETRQSNEDIRQEQERLRQNNTTTAIRNINTTIENANNTIDKMNIAIEKTKMTDRYSGSCIYSVDDSVPSHIVIQEIDGKTEQITTTGVNLFDIHKIVPTGDEGGVKVLSDDEIEISGKSAYAGGAYSLDSDIISLISGKQIYFSCNIRQKSPYRATAHLKVVKNDNTVFYVSYNTSGAIPNDIKTIYVELLVNNNSNAYETKLIATFSNVMISLTEVGYEPYTGGQPSPSPNYPQEIKSVGTLQANGKYTVEVKSCGVNLFDKDRITKGLWLNDKGETNTGSMEFFITDRIRVTTGTYVLYGTSPYIADSYGACVYKGTSFIKNFVVNAVEPTFIDIPENADTVIFTGQFIDCDSLIFAKLTDIPVYEPYKSSTAIIELDQPLYEGDKLCVVKAGESYTTKSGDIQIADTDMWGVYRKMRHIKMSKNININTFIQKTNFSRVGVSLESMKYPEGHRYDFFSNKFQKIDTTNVNDVTLNKVFVSAFNDWSNERAVFGIPSSIDTAEMAKQYLVDNDVELVYEMNFPYFSPLSAESQIKLFNLHSFDGMTHIYTTDPLEPTLTVDVAKKSDGAYLLNGYCVAMKNQIQSELTQQTIDSQLASTFSLLPINIQANMIETDVNNLLQGVLE